MLYNTRDIASGTDTIFIWCRNAINSPPFLLSTHDFKKEATLKQVRELNDWFNGMRKMAQDLLGHVSRPYPTWELFNKLDGKQFEEPSPGDGVEPEGPKLSTLMFKIENQACLIENLHKDLKVLKERLDFGAKEVSPKTILNPVFLVCATG